MSFSRFSDRNNEYCIERQHLDSIHDHREAKQTVYLEGVWWWLQCCQGRQTCAALVSGDLQKDPWSVIAQFVSFS